MININIENNTNDSIHLSNNWIKLICKTILKENNYSEGKITIIFTNDRQLAQFKKQYFNQDLLTDVIAFNLEEKYDPLEGEIYISIDRVKENSLEFNENIINELKRVIIHGCLHLIGYKDESIKQKKQMTHLENQYLKISYLN